jgi:hypothetical protein
VNGQTASLNLNLDCWASETTWELAIDGGAVLYSGTGYVDDNPITINLDFCLDYDCYTFTINDSYGDGMTGCSAANGGAGTYQIVYDGNVEAEITEAQANFGNTNSQTFCLIDDTGIEEMALANALFVYPNPSEGEFIVQNKLGIIDAVEVLNLQGQVIYTNKVAASSTTIKLGEIASGTYFVRVMSNGSAAMKQLVVK